MASSKVGYRSLLVEGNPDEEQATESATKKETQSKDQQGGRRATFVVCFTVIFCYLGFHLAMTADGTVLFRKVPMPKPLKVVAQLGRGKMRDISKSENFQPMPQPFPADLDKLSQKEREARASYWITLLSFKFLGLVMIGTFVVLVPIPRCLGGDAPDQRLTPEQWTIMLCSTMCPFVTYTVAMTFKAASSKLLCRAGLGWELWNSLFDIGASGLLGQAVGVRVLRPRAKYKFSAFAGAVFQSMTPFIGDPFDSSKDATFAGLAWSYGTSFSKAISVASYGWLLGLHVHMMTDPNLQLELRASYLPVFSQVPLPETVGTQAPLVPAAPVVPAGEGGSWCKCPKIPKFWDAVQPLLPKLLMQARPCKQESLVREDVPQGTLASVYMGYLWYMGQPIMWFVFLLNIVVPLARIVAAWLSYGHLVWWCYVWVLKQFLISTGAGLEEAALEFREMALHVRTMEGGESHHRQALEILRLETHDLGLQAASRALIFQFFKALKDKEQAAALEVVQDCLLLCSLDPSGFGQAWAESLKPAVDLSLFREVLTAIASSAVKLIGPLHNTSPAEVWCCDFQGAVRFLGWVSEIHDSGREHLDSALFAAIRSKEAKIGNAITEEARWKRCSDGMRAKIDDKILEPEAARVLMMLFHPGEIVAGAERQTTQDGSDFGRQLKEFCKKMVNRLELVASGKQEPEAGDMLFHTAFGSLIPFGALGTVTGPADGDAKGKGLSMVFHGNPSNVNVDFANLSAVKPEPPRQLYNVGSDEVSFGALGTVIGPAEGSSTKGNGFSMAFQGRTDHVDVFFHELSDTRPTKVGDYEIGKKLFYVGADIAVTRYTKVVFGDEGEVKGPLTGELKGQGLLMSFDYNNVKVFFPNLSATKPEMPRGHKIGDQLFYKGAEQTLANGDKLTFAALGTVVGPATGVLTGKGLLMAFEGNKINSNVLFADLVAKKPELPGKANSRSWFQR